MSDQDFARWQELCDKIANTGWASLNRNEERDWRRIDILIDQINEEAWQANRNGSQTLSCFI